MSKVLGIISEYNPFHNGHLYHLTKSKEITKSNYTIAIISGNFTQRGSTSLVDKWSKARMALDNGIDLVIELPLLYSISSAENFAEGSIKILNSLKIVDYISFGSENPDIESLNKLADIIYKEPKDYKNILQDRISKGISFPKAREEALISYLENIESNNKKDNNTKINIYNLKNVLSAPNNILGIEYLKAIKKSKSTIKPIAIERTDCGYNDIKYNGNIASSTAIRNIIKNGNFDILQKLVPSSTYSNIIKSIQLGHIIPDLSCFEKQIIYNLRQMSIEEIQELHDVSEGLEFTIKKAANSCNSLVELLNIIKSKRYTTTRIQRILLYALLNITKKDMLVSKKTSPYIRVLGFNERGKYLISEISKANPKLEIITSVKKFIKCNTNKNLGLLLDKDIWATNVYTIGYENDSWCNLDFTHKIEL